jgi:hypothetical protein
MSPSDPASGRTPPEVLAIAVALAVLWPGAEPAVDATGAAEPGGAWRLGGRQWERGTSHRWS